MNNDSQPSQAAEHRRKALEFLGAAQEGQRILDALYEQHPDPATRPRAIGSTIGGLNQSIRIGLKAAQVHATLATIPAPPVASPGHLDPCPVGGFHAFRASGLCACGLPYPGA